MRLYRTEIGQWAGTQADARKFAATHGVDWEQVEVPTDKPGLLAWLNNMAAGNGPNDTMIDDGDEPEFRPTLDDYRNIDSEADMYFSHFAGRKPTNAEKSVGFEDEFENFPLALKLHYAALAMEEAREKIQ